MGRFLFYLLQFTWGLPVNLLGGLFFLCCLRYPHQRFRGCVLTKLPGNRGGLSLGIFVFLSGSNELAAHEYGHTLQCLLLGPLYYPVILIPSVIWFHCFRGFRRRRKLPYSALYCERWADRWGRKQNTEQKKVIL